MSVEGSGFVLHGLQAGEVAAALGGRLVQGDATARLPDLSTDSRREVAGRLYFALRGERLDGHAFVADVVRRGAWGVVVERGEGPWPAALVVIEVADTTRALGRLAAAVIARRRQRGGLQVVALTGSNGKTTTKELLGALLGARHQVLRTAGNFNNWIGMPLTVMGLKWAHTALVLEMGANAPGEIAAMVDIAAPDVALLTCVAPAHLEGFGSLAGVAAAKGELFSGASLAKIVVPRGVAAWYPALVGDARVTWVDEGGAAEAAGGAASGWRVVSRRSVGDGQEVILDTPGGRLRVGLPLLGAHNALNLALALAALEPLGLGEAEIQGALAGLRLPSGRLELWSCAGGAELLHDAYNANPASMRAALGVLRERARPGHGWAVLGEMRELGAESEALHAALGREVAALGLVHLFAVGDKGAVALAGAAVSAGMTPAAVRQVSVDGIAEVVALLESRLAADDVVLIKGSRGVALERVVEGLKASRRG